MSKSVTSRDRVLLLSAWILISLFVLGMWAFSPTENVAESTSQIEPGVGLLLVVIIVPSILFSLSLGARGKSMLATFNRYFQSRVVFVALMVGLALGEIYYIFVEVGTFRAESFIMLIISVVLLLHLLVGRPSVSIAVVALLAVWFISLVLARQSLTQMLAVGDFWSASWRYRAIVLGLSALIALFTLLPIVYLSSRFTGAAKTSVERLAPYSGWFFLLALGFSLLILIFNQLTDFERLQPVLLGRISIILLAILASIAAFRRGSSFRQTMPAGFTDLRRPVYIGGLAAVALAFLIVSSQISISGINPDGLSYFTIARNYAEGNPVVRGYWSPLLSWLMAPAIAVGADPIAAYKGLTQLTTLAWMIITVLIARRWGLSRYIRIALAVLVSLISLTFGFALITPDLLGAAIFGFGFYVLTDARLSARPVLNGMIFGFAIALSYYAKYYNLAFFIVLVPALILILIARGDSKANSVKVISISAATAAILVLPWIIGIWTRYGEVTLTTSAAISRAVVGPNSAGHICWENQLCDGPRDVLFPGEDPQLRYYADAGWSPFESIPLLRHQIRLLWDNALKWIEPVPIGPHPIPPVFLAALVLLPLLFWDDAGTNSNYSLGLIVFGLYATGYMFTFGGELRYYFPIIPIAWLAAYAVIEKGLFTALPRSLPHWAYPPLMAVILAIPILAFSWFADIRFRVQIEADTCLEQAAEVMADYLVPPIAGTDLSIHYLAYFTGIPTRGVASPTASTSSFDSQLRTLGIRTLVTPAHTDLVEELIIDYAYSNVQTLEVCGDMVDVLRIP